jgi:hypothetical protein
MAASSLPERVHDAWRHPGQLRACVYCGGEFVGRTDGRRPGLCCSTKCAARLRFQQRPKPRNTIPCPRCGAEFWPWKNGKHPRKYCSATCAIQPKQPTPVIVKPTHPCLWCKEQTARPKFCTFDCYTRASAGRKHLRKRQLKSGEVVSLPDIYARDNGVCQLCHRRVRAGLPPLHPMAATLDHIIPLRKGGTHTRANVQLAHRSCNSAKGTRACGSQLRLC